MKQNIILGVLVTFSIGLFGQTKVETAIVRSVTEITFPQNQNAGGSEDEGPRMSGMESSSTVYFKGDFLKTENKTDFGNNTVIVDKKAGRTVTITEAMGKKSGYYSNAEEEEKMRKRMDSLRQAGGNNQQRQPNEGNQNRGEAKLDVVETGETKKIAGYNCKKAIIKSTQRNGDVNETTVWYSPDIKMPEGYPAPGAGQASGGRGFSGSFGGGPRAGATFGAQGLEKINGFVMEYEVSRPNGFSMKMQVKKIDINPDIKDKVFEVPSNLELKPISEMQNNFGQGQGGFRFGRPGN